MRTNDGLKLTYEHRTKLNNLLFDLISDALLVYDNQGYIVQANNAASFLFQYDRSELIGLHSYNLISDPHHYLFDEFNEQVLTGENNKSNIEFIKKDGTLFVMDIKGIPFQLNEDKLFLITLRRIPEKKEIFEHTKSSENVKRLLNHNPDVLWTRDQHGNTLFITDNINDLIGIDSNEFYTDTTRWYKIVHPDDTSKVKDAFENLFLHDKPYDIEYRVRDDNGIWIWINDRSGNLYNENNRLLANGILSEINNRKKIEMELREAKELFKTLFNDMADPVMILDKKGKFIELTDRVKEYTGFEKNEILGQNFLKTKLLTPKSKAICIKNLMKRMAGIHVDPYEVEALTKEGELILFEVNAKRIMYNGEPADLVIFRDISSRVEAEKKLRQSEKTYRNLFQNAQVGLFRTNLDDGRIIECNNQFAKMFGFKNRKEFYKKFTIEKFYVHHEDRFDLVDKLKKNGYVDFFEAAFYRKDKSIFWARYSANLDKEMNWIEGVFEDITELKKAEDKLKMKHEQLKSEQQQLLSIFDSINHAIYVADPKTYEILYTNSQLRSALKKNVTGKKCYEILQDNTQPCDFCTNHIILKNKGKPYKWEYRNPRTKRDYELIDKIITWPDGRYVRMEMAIDITDRKRTLEEVKSAHQTVSVFNKKLEEKVKEKTERIEKLLKQKDEFINQLGHDLKNPLSPLVNLLPLVEQHITDEKYKEMIRISRRNVGYMKNLVIKTIELAKLNSPNTQFLFEPIHLLLLVDDIIDSNKYLSSQKKIRIKNSITNSLIISADKLRMEELFTNLLNNAIKYSKQNGLVEISSKDEGDQVLLSITDEGIGMNSEQIIHLFDEFYKADESRHDFESSGLGLPICKRIVERHNGQIWAESAGINQGSTIFIRLPKSNSSNELHPSQSEQLSQHDTIRQKIDSLIQE